MKKIGIGAFALTAVLAIASAFAPKVINDPLAWAKNAQGQCVQVQCTPIQRGGAVACNLGFAAYYSNQTDCINGLNPVAAFTIVNQ